jgi:hypothetical protein
MELAELTPQKIREMTKAELCSLVEEHDLAVVTPKKLKRDDLVEAVLDSLNFGEPSDYPSETPVDEDKVADSKGAIQRLYVNPGAGRWGSKAKGNPRFIVERIAVERTGILVNSIENYEWLLSLKNSRGISIFQKEMPVKKAGAPSSLSVNSLRTGG